MSRYAGDSRFVEWMRKKFKIEKPEALGWGEWEEWDAKLKRERPIAFFMTETLPNWYDNCGKLVRDPFNNVRYWFVFRNYHRITTQLDRGRYYEFHTRVKFAMFDALVDYVETELAEHQVRWSDELLHKHKAPWWMKHWWTKWSRWHNQQAGIAHLQWEMELDGPDIDPNQRCLHQAENARETFILYNWWRYVRPNRVSVDVRSGMSDFSKKMDEKYNNDWYFNDKLTDEEQTEYAAINVLHRQLEQQDDDEEIEMMQRLVKHSRNLWT